MIPLFPLVPFKEPNEWRQSGVFRIRTSGSLRPLTKADQSSQTTILFLTDKRGLAGSIWRYYSTTQVLHGPKTRLRFRKTGILLMIDTPFIYSYWPPLTKLHVYLAVYVVYEICTRVGCGWPRVSSEGDEISGDLKEQLYFCCDLIQWNIHVFFFCIFFSSSFVSYVRIFLVLYDWSETRKRKQK